MTTQHMALAAPFSVFSSRLLSFEPEVRHLNCWNDTAVNRISYNCVHNCWHSLYEVVSSDEASMLHKLHAVLDVSCAVVKVVVSVYVDEIQVVRNLGVAESFIACGFNKNRTSVSFQLSSSFSKLLVMRTVVVVKVFALRVWLQRINTEQSFDRQFSQERLKIPAPSVADFATHQRTTALLLEHSCERSGNVQIVKIVRQMVYLDFPVRRKQLHRGFDNSPTRVQGDFSQIHGYPFNIRECLTAIFLLFAFKHLLRTRITNKLAQIAVLGYFSVQHFV